MIVRLTPAQCARADAVAEGRYHKMKDVPDEGNVPRSLLKERIGARGELAVAITLGLDDQWPPTSTRYDVGGHQVRTASKPWHNMLLQPWRPGFHPEDSHIFVRPASEADDTIYAVLGWCYGADYTMGIRRDLGYGSKPYILRPDQLRPMDDLPR